jgi:pSer/pThr/pTyr-binding forkhead associated (FHA) protein
MPAHLTLTLPPTFGNRTVEVQSKRFSIGRTPENDLTIEDKSLSRRHALIEVFEGCFNLSDCVSSNGTFINGTRITAPTELNDWDVLTFGGIGDIVVRIEDDPALSDQGPTGSSSNRYTSGIESTYAQARKPSVTAYSSFNKPTIAIVAAVTILVMTGLALLIAHRSSPKSNSNLLTTKQQRSGDSDNTRAETSNDTTSLPGDGNSSKPDDANNSNIEPADLSAIEAYASRVLMGVSRDTHPVLTEKPLTAIHAQVQQYKGSPALQEELRAMKRALPQVTAIAKSNSVRTPLAVYVTLAKIDKAGGRGDPAQVAAALCPVLARMRAVFGDELANDSLLAIAALEEGESLQSRITKLAGRVNDSPATIRSIWYLHDHRIISEQTYNFVIRFIVMGVIAQDPRKFGIGVDPLSF